MNLNTSLSEVRGVGDKTYQAFAKAGLLTVHDLITFLPRKHEDYTGVTPIAQLVPGKVTIKARAESVETKVVRRGLRLTKAVLADESGKLNAIWFNQAYRAAQLKNSSQEFYFSGDLEYQYGRFQLTSPSAELAKEVSLKATKLVPIYHTVKGLKSQLVRKVLETLRPLMSVLPETLPAEVLIGQNMMSYSEAISKIHFPASLDEANNARQRLAFDEIFELLLASRLNKVENQKLEGYKIPFDAKLVKRFVDHLPFKLTDGQRIAAWDILQDFEHSTPMNRMVQGDVGSGKTVVTGIAMLEAWHHGFQSALLAPTEILAVQHAETLHSLLEPFGVKVGLLTGRLKPREKTALKEQISLGNVDIVIGTHAVLQDSVHFKKLGFVVVDEQHRFGVEQRQKLLAKSGKMPHLLSMTATPIPRSLALTVYGELDISVINQKPANRLPIKTSLVSPVSRDKAYTLVDAEIANGHQVYVICSLIEENSENDLKSVESEYKRLKNSVFGHRKIALLHGKMKQLEKNQIMEDFKNHKFDILVSTTVVEVGVDVPNATVIMIEDAEQFGLAQLHQLRGRVGRSDLQSYCYLMLGTNNKPSKRLREIEKSNDGFHLAEVDMDIRGPGEIYGKRQSGELNLQVANLADTRLIARASSAAERLVSSGFDLGKYPDLKMRIRKFQRVTTLN